MSENVRSMLLTPAGLYFLLIVALILSLVRSPRHVEVEVRTRLVEVFLIGIVCQCAHMTEEFVTGFHVLFPSLFDLAPLSGELFVGFNVFWLGVWVLAAYGVLHGYRVAYFPVWFFGLAMCFNGIAHPLLSIMSAGYFPGLITSPIVGVLGILVIRKLFQITERKPEGHTEKDT